MSPPTWWIHGTEATVQLSHTHLLNDRDDCEVSFKRQQNVGHSLSLYPLRGGGERERGEGERGGRERE